MLNPGSEPESRRAFRRPVFIGFELNLPKEKLWSVLLGLDRSEFWSLPVLVWSEGNARFCPGPTLVCRTGLSVRMGVSEPAIGSTVNLTPSVPFRLLAPSCGTTLEPGSFARI